MIISVLNRRFIILTTVLICLIILAVGCATSGNRTVDGPVDDIYITKSIKDKIAADPDLSTLRVRVICSQGEVILSGTAPARNIKTRLIKLALSVHGVRSVKDDIIIKRP